MAKEAVVLERWTRIACSVYLCSVVSLSSVVERRTTTSDVVERMFGPFRSPLLTPSFRLARGEEKGRGTERIRMDYSAFPFVSKTAIIYYPPSVAHREQDGKQRGCRRIDPLTCFTFGNERKATNESDEEEWITKKKRLLCFRPPPWCLSMFAVHPS